MNTFSEETKQISYAHRMELVNEPRGETWPSYDMHGQSVIDLGGGPVSMLLKTVNATRPTVVDPITVPNWVRLRYFQAGIRFENEPVETWVPGGEHWDEAWIYNVLQHVMDPEEIVHRAITWATTVRIFEWLEVPACPGHPHVLHGEELDRWFESRSMHRCARVINTINENGCVGQFYAGVWQAREPVYENGPLSIHPSLQGF